MAIGLALASALLFGLSTPAAKLLVGGVDPGLLAGLLYLASGLGLGLYRLIGRAAGRRGREAPLTLEDLPWLTGAVVAGGVLGPVLLLRGLAAGPATQAALLLNLEAVFTALLAVLLFGEHVGARVAVGMAAIVGGATVLAWSPGAGLALDRSALLVAGASLAWALDNNLTGRVAGGDALQIAAIKGGAAGIVNVAIALARGAAWPTTDAVLGAGLVGLLGYGVSLVLFVLALRHLGAARTGAYFATAPFVGALAGVLALGEALTAPVLAAGALMALGVGLHLTERHGHEHAHEALAHDHRHPHDEHHAHAHDAAAPAGEPHAHPHVHVTVRHAHPHYPDLHHRHPH